jgi:hypothetical protein
MRAHVKRMTDWAIELWKADDMSIHLCEGTTLEGQKTLLNDIRQDGCAMIGCVNQMVDVLAEIAHAPEDATADDLRKIAQRVIKT